MKFVSLRGFIFGMILFLLISDIHGTHVRRRREDKDDDKSKLNWQAILDDVRKIPAVGSTVRKALVNVAHTVGILNKLTNGALSRIAGGYPPCEIGFDGIQCKGKPTNGGIVGITTELVNSTLLPGIAKTMIIDVLDTGFFPILNLLFGIPVQSKKKKM